jgi:hypothetical protein
MRSIPNDTSISRAVARDTPASNTWVSPAITSLRPTSVNQQLAGPHHSQAVIDHHRLELVVMLDEQRPGRAVPVPACGRPRSATVASSSSPSCPSPNAGSRPHAIPAATYRRTVLRSTRASRPAERSPSPRSHGRRSTTCLCCSTTRLVSAMPPEQSEVSGLVLGFGRSRTL